MYSRRLQFIYTHLIRYQSTCIIIVKPKIKKKKRKSIKLADMFTSNSSVQSENVLTNLLPAVYTLHCCIHTLCPHTYCQNTPQPCTTDQPQAIIQSSHKNQARNSQHAWLSFCVHFYGQRDCVLIRSNLPLPQDTAFSTKHCYHCDPCQGEHSGRHPQQEQGLCQAAG